MTRNELTILVDAYLAAGGRIFKCPPAVAGGAWVNELTREAVDAKRKEMGYND